jgi:predicted HAD superfamily Cof-like phosphohydrolase
MSYDNLTDDELIRVADGQSGLVRALSERLEMRQTPHMSVFDEQAFFMRACGQHTAAADVDQASMYRQLINEELEELRAAEFEKNTVEQFDAVLDIIVVLIGYGLSRGWPMAAGWDEVMRSNMAKIDPATGSVLRRADGKILKPPSWTPPDLHSILNPSQIEMF